MSEQDAKKKRIRGGHKSFLRDPNEGLYPTSEFYIPGSSMSIGSSRTMQCWKQDKYQGETPKVHSNPEHSDIDHFNYLHSLLKGSATDALSSHSLSATNYTEAVAVLERKILAINSRW
ncbi:hypothetical protein EMCRGX_G004229 [Ephydatia muelleri]